MQARGRRNQVIAAAVEVPADWKPPVYEKPAEDEQFLKDTMLTNKLMKNLNPSDRALQRETFSLVAPYLQFLEEKGLALKAVLLTHVHADFVSGHLDLAALAGTLPARGAHIHDRREWHR